MKYFLNILLVAFMLCQVVGCNSGSSEEETEWPAEQINEESIDENIVEEAFSFNLMLLEYGKVALQKENIPERIQEFAQLSVGYHQELNEELQAIAMENEILLPEMVGENVEEFALELRGKEGAEFADDYIEVVDEIQGNMVAEYQEAVDSEYGPEVRSFASETLSTISQREELVDELQEFANEIE